MADINYPDLVSCKWLEERLQEGLPDSVVILDVSWSSSKDCEAEYKQCHIPGARYFNVMNGNHDEMFPRNLPDVDKFQQAAREAGIQETSHVILYSTSDRCGYFLSGRAWWTFKFFGISKISILDGGLQKWQQSGGTVTSAVSEVKAGDFTVKKSLDVYRTHTDVTKILDAPGSPIQICDTRPKSAFSGNESKGHIPTAKNLPMSCLVDEKTGVLKSVQDLTAAFEEAGLAVDRPLVTHCNSGMSSCTVAFAAALCGFSNVGVYHGGFTEFNKRSPDRVEK